MGITKRTIQVVTVSCAAMLLSACGFSDLDNLSNGDSSDPVSSSSLASTAQVDKSISDQLAQQGEKAQDDWFIANLLQSGVDIDRDTALDEREKVCSMLKSGSTAGDVAQEFPKYTDEQMGVFIASSMISHCADASAIM